MTLNTTGQSYFDGSQRVTPDYLFLNMTAATTYVVKSGSGILHSIVNNTGISGATLTITDNTASGGTAIALLTSATTLGTFTYDINFNTGLTIVSSSGVNATVCYK